MLKTIFLKVYIYKETPSKAVTSTTSGVSVRRRRDPLERRSERIILCAKMLSTDERVLLNVPIIDFQF